MSGPSERQLRRLRWAVRAVLTLGVAASLAANVLHARQNPISQTIAGWPPVALLLTVELISRIPMQRRGLGWVRVLATAVIAGIAAWVSYWHMAGVAARYGEQGSAPYLLPFSVDGLIVVASVCLVELSDRLRVLEAIAPEPAATVEPVTDSAPAAVADTAAVSVATMPRPRRRTDRRTANADKIARAVAKMPGASYAAIAAKVGVSERTVQRHLSGAAVDSKPDSEHDTTPDTTQVNGVTPDLDAVPA